MPFQNWPQDRRINKWTGADESLLISAESLIVPSSSPYEVELYEIPREDTPSSVTVRAGSSTSNVNPTEDTWIDEGNPSSTHGSDIYLAAGRMNAGSGSWKVRSLLKWDVSALPADASSVKLYFYREVGYSAPIYSVHRITGSWSAGSANWSNQPAFDLVPAGTFQIVAGQNGWYFCDITALYNAWKAGTYANHGILLRTDEVATDTVSNWTSVDGASGQRPHMDIVAAGALYEEVDASVAPAAGQVAVNYPYGRLRFHSSAAGATVEVGYFGKGTLVGAGRLFAEGIPASMISAGKPGMMIASNTHLYICIEPNNWRRIPLDTF